MTAGALFYLVGPPGVGKSSALAAALRPWTVVPNPSPTPLSTMAVVDAASGRIVALELGRRRERFPGTDALSMSVAPVASRWIRTLPHRLILGEGQRLAIRPFFIAAIDAGYRLTVISLTAPKRVLDERCAERGSKQSAAWAMGALTRAEKITDWAAEHAAVIRIDAGQPLAHVAEQLHSAIMPMVGAE